MPQGRLARRQLPKESEVRREHPTLSAIETFIQNALAGGVGGVMTPTAGTSAHAMKQALERVIAKFDTGSMQGNVASAFESLGLHTPKTLRLHDRASPWAHRTTPMSPRTSGQAGGLMEGRRARLTNNSNIETSNAIDGVIKDSNVTGPTQEETISRLASDQLGLDPSIRPPEAPLRRAPKGGFPPRPRMGDYAGGDDLSDIERLAQDTLKSRKLEPSPALSPDDAADLIGGKRALSGRSGADPDYILDSIKQVRAGYDPLTSEVPEDAIEWVIKMLGIGGIK